MSARSRSAPRPRHDAYAVCPPGTEVLCAAELAALGIKAVKPGRGGVTFTATARQLYAANLWSRTATRVLVRVAEFEATSFAELSRRAAALDLDPWLGGRAPQLRVSASRAALYHTDAIAERLHHVWGTPEDVPPPVCGVDPDGLADDRDDDEPIAPLLVVRNVSNHITVSVDCSGVPLYKRGWRHDVAKAPLRENLAAAVLLASGWPADGVTPLLDPFCGSGTIPIEAALLAIGRPPGFMRSFAFFQWPSFEPGTWASVVGQAADAERTIDAPLTIVAADRDAGAVAATRANAARAEVAQHVEIVERSMSATEAPSPGAPRRDAGWVVTNPPYGGRIDHGGDLRNVYARLGSVVRERLPGWSVAMLVADRRLAAHSGLSLHERLRTGNGGIDVELLVSSAGARRDARPGRRGAGHGRGPSHGRGRAGGGHDGRGGSGAADQGPSEPGEAGG